MVPGADGGGADGVQHAVRVEAARDLLHVEALRRALEEIVRRHEPLRTTFAMIDEEPVQVIGTIERFELPLEDLAFVRVGTAGRTKSLGDVGWRRSGPLT